MATVTDPIILDSTGQDIVTALNNLNTPRDTAAYTTSFASSDTDDASATSWTVVSPIAGGETHATLFGKLSQIAKNVRYLYKTLGNTDLSAIADGTVTGAIAASQWVDVTSDFTFNTSYYSNYRVICQKMTKTIRIQAIGNDVPNSSVLVTIPSKYTVDSGKVISYSGSRGLLVNVAHGYFVPSSALSGYYTFTSSALFRNNNTVTLSYPVSATSRTLTVDMVYQYA